MSESPTEPQKRIYQFIREYTQREGRPPTNREIGQAVGIKSTGHVDHHLSALERKGLILRFKGVSRGIRLLKQGVFIAGTIAAGQPIDHYPEADQDTLDMNATVTSQAYLLRVKGDSMVDDHITDGDFVLINPEPDFHDGDIIVATHMTAGDGGAATLKRIYLEKGRTRLQPANSAHQPIYVDAAEWDREWQVQGKVCAVYRQC